MTTDAARGAPHDDGPPSGGSTGITVTALVERGRSLGTLWKLSRPGRAVQRYGAGRGALLCGGIAYSALFSVFAALAIGYTVFATVLGDHQKLQDSVLESVNTLVPGLIDVDGEGGATGLITPDQLIVSGSFWPTLAYSLVLLWTAITFMTALRRGIRAMFGLSEIGQNPVLSKVWSLIGFIGLALGVLVSSAATIVVASLSEQIVDLLNLGHVGEVGVTFAGLLVSLVIDTLLVAGVVVVLAGARPTAKALWAGSLLAGLAFGVLRYLGTSVVVGSASRNPLFASVAVIITLLLLVNFVARVLLLICAWMANPPYVDPHPEPVETLDERLAREEAVYAGAGRGYPWSPLVRGVRRGRTPRPPRLVRRGEAIRPEQRPSDPSVLVL